MPDERISEGLTQRPPQMEGDFVKQARPRAEYLKDHDINIRFFSVGCVISVGCKSIPFTSVKEGVDALTAYIDDPAKEIAKWNEIFNKNE